MTVTHVTKNSLLHLSGWPVDWSVTLQRACDGDGEFDPAAIASADARDTVPTCPRCAVLRDEALEGRLPQRDASGNFGGSPGVK